MPKPLLFPTASVANGLIYVFEGTDTFAYDPNSDEWSAKAHFSPSSMGMGSATVDGIIYLFGGMTEDMYGAYDCVWAYDPVNDRFSAKRRIPKTLVTPACGAIDGKVYLTGGVSKEPVYNPGAVFYKRLNLFDPQGGTAPLIRSATMGSDNRLRLVWRAEAGMTYGVEYSAQVSATRWGRVLLPTGLTVTATNDVVETSCPVIEGLPQRFYRVFETN